MDEPKRLILFASGSGSNVLNVCNYFKNSSKAKVVALFCNNKQAGVLEKVKPFNIPTHLFTKQELNQPEFFLPLIQQYQPDLICLLGFLLQIPSYLVQQYPQKIINLHPALLPKYGGKGMFGQFVHKAVKNAGESETGITIHYVNEKYDEGAIIKQFKVALNNQDSVEDIANKISELEMQHVPEVIESLL
ncbi:MAG: phosphoribosylglycinamide formyltransferase [Bacteroidia bacterium]